MKLGEYLKKLDLSPGGFARSSKIARATVMHILGGGGCHTRAAVRIFRTTHGLVTLEDLAGPEPVEKLEDDAQGDGMERA